AALIAAGPEILAVAGIISGVGAGLSLLGIEFYEVWKHSERFRSIIKLIGSEISDIWKNDIVPFARGVRDEFEKNVLPPLRKLWEYINDNVLPAIYSFWDNFYEKHKGTFKEILNDFQSVIRFGFQAVAWVINNLL